MKYTHSDVAQQDASRLASDVCIKLKVEDRGVENAIWNLSLATQESRKLLEQLLKHTKSPGPWPCKKCGNTKNQVSQLIRLNNLTCEKCQLRVLLPVVRDFLVRECDPFEESCL